jgi:cell division protein FtsB
MQEQKPLREISWNVKLSLAALVIILVLLEFRFLFGADSLIKVYKLKQTILAQEQQLTDLKLRNEQLSNKIEILKKYPLAIEEQARYELGMVRQGEKYFQVVEPIE